MAGAQSYVTIDDKEVRKDLEEFMEKCGNLRVPLKAFGEHMLLVTEERFSGEHGPSGIAWMPLSPATLKTKKGTKILTENSNLRDRIIYSADARKMAYGTNVVYGAIHQFGGQAGRGRKVSIPARPFLGMDEADMEEWRRAIIDYLGRKKS
jgi:phage virion morphogenesis protein